MRNFIVLAMLCIGCGKDYNTTQVTQVVEVSEERLFDELYYLSGSSNNCIQIDQFFDGIANIFTPCQRLVSVNPKNGTFGEFPSLHIRNALIEGNKIRFSQYLNFTDANDIEEDVSGSNVRGRKKVDGLIQLVDGRLQLELKVYKNETNLNSVVVTRTFTEE